MGAERRSMVMPEDERRNTAYHESGHALVGTMLPKSDPIPCRVPSPGCGWNARPAFRPGTSTT